MPTATFDPRCVPDDLRALGWSVAVHNDYRLNGTHHTFWLLSKGNQCRKGEGHTDAEALDQIRTELKLPIPAGPAPGPAALKEDRTHLRAPIPRNPLRAGLLGLLKVFGLPAAQVALVADSPANNFRPRSHSAPEPLNQRDILNALERQIASLEHEADRLAGAMNYDAEFPGEDARMLRQVADLISSNRIHFLVTPDPMDAPLPCPIQIGHIKFGAGVPLSVLHQHAKRMYSLAYGEDADDVANEPLEVRKARGDAVLARLRSSSLETDPCLVPGPSAARPPL